MKLDLNTEEFILNAIESLRKPPYKGIHCVWSGFNRAFRQYFPNIDPVDATNELVEKGIIEIKPTKGGGLIYKKGEGPSAQASDVLRKILKHASTNDDSSR